MVQQLLTMYSVKGTREIEKYESYKGQKGVTISQEIELIDE